jgi:hypothetical protein
MTDSALEGTAKRLFEKFGFNEISIEQFDIFIIDHGLADDPQTNEPSDIAYKGFIQQRGQAKGKLNRAAARLFDNPYTIEVVISGETYQLRRWHESSSHIATDLGNRVRKFTENRFSQLQLLQTKVDKRFIEHPEDHDLAQTSALFGIMRQEGVQVLAKVKALAYQYNVAADAVEDQALQMLEKYSDEDNTLVTLPAPDVETTEK